MDEARPDIEDRFVGLRRRHHQRRQTEITEELLDTVSGFGDLERADRP